MTGAVVVFSTTNLAVASFQMAPMQAALYRMWLGVVLLFGVLRVTGRRPRLGVLRVAAPAALAYGANIWLLFGALQATSLVNATLIVALQPAVTLTLVGRLYGEVVRTVDLVMCAAATGGVVLVIVGGSTGGSGHLRGDVLAVGAMAAGVAYFGLAKHARTTQQTPAGEYQFGLLAVAAAATVPAFLLLDGTLSLPDEADWLRLAAVACGATAGHLAINWAHRWVPLKTTTLFTLGVPVLSTALAWVVLGEQLSALQTVGGLLTLAALAGVIAGQDSQAEARTR